ncbi:MAG TPA: class E sortase [bacterium]|jgi:sortase A
MALIVSGLLLAAGPVTGIRLWDAYLARQRGVEAARWLRDHESPAPAVRASVIEPGADGYLLEIPKIGLRIVVRSLEPDVFSGKNTALLKRYGVGQIPYSASLRNVSPGASGTAAITGHRTTSGAPFRNINQLGPGDRIIIRKGRLVQQWEVVYTTTVVPSQVEAIKSYPGVRRLVILACNPPFSARQRLIVYARPAPVDSLVSRRNSPRR